MIDYTEIEEKILIAQNFLSLQSTRVFFFEEFILLIMDYQLKYKQISKLFIDLVSKHDVYSINTNNIVYVNDDIVYQLFKGTQLHKINDHLFDVAVSLINVLRSG